MERASSGLTISEALVYDPAQSRLYATNVNNRVSMFDVDRATGAITALPFSPFFIQGALHGCMAVSPDGSILVGADLLSPFVDSLRIATSGVTPAPGSPFSAGSPSFSCAFRRDGGAVYTGGNIPFISGWTVSPSTGTLTPMPGSPFATPVIATGYATDTLNRLFTVSFTDGAVRAYSIEGGAPALLGSPTPSSQTGQIQGVMHPFGYYLATARNSNNVAVFRISGLGAGTTLTQVPGSPFATGGTFSNASIVDPSGQVVITANGSSRNLTTFLFDSGTGAMTPALLQPANTMGATGGIIGLAFARKAGVTTPTPGPAPPPPTITSIPNQSMLQNSTISVPFTIAGSVLVSALRVSIASSNTALLPVSPSALSTSCNSSGACTLRITPADGRAGSSTITLTVSDGTSATSTSFVVTVTAVRPSAPGVVLANPLGSGFAVTWSPPDTGTPMAYAVSWGTNTTASNLPLQLVPGTTPRFDVTAVPNGTYYFRIYAVGTGDLSPPSPLRQRRGHRRRQRAGPAAGAPHHGGHEQRDVELGRTEPRRGGDDLRSARGQRLRDERRRVGDDGQRDAHGVESRGGQLLGAHARREWRPRRRLEQQRADPGRVGAVHRRARHADSAAGDDHAGTGDVHVDRHGRRGGDVRRADRVRRRTPAGRHAVDDGPGHEPGVESDERQLRRAARRDERVWRERALERGELLGAVARGRIRTKN